MSKVVSDKKIIFIVGPTASGKSKLSYGVINQFGGCIVNCDSLQVYDGLDIGSAKPSAEELSGIPNYLFGEVAKGEEFTAGKFRKRALEIIESTDHKLYVFVGGSGFYIQALVKGMFEEAPIKEEAKNKVTKLKEELGVVGLYELLKKEDPDYADSIHQNDTYRVGRALELIMSLGKSMAQINIEFSALRTELPYSYMYMGTKIERERLRGKVALRLEQMMAAGFRLEVETLIKEGFGQWKPMSSVGYKEMMGLIDGQFDMEFFNSEVIKNTMRLAKRQMTWFKRNKEIHWLELENDGQLDHGLKICKDFLLSGPQ